MATIDNNKYLSLSGLQTFWTNVKAYVDAVKVTINDNASNFINVTPNGTESRSFTIEDSALVAKINEMDGIDAGLRTDLTNEINRAKDAEKVLTDNLAQEITNRDNAVKQLKSELVGDAATEYNTLGKLEDKVQAVDAKLDAAIGQGGNVANQIKTAIEALDVTDAAVDGSYVSAVSETDGKISVSRTVLPTYNVSANDTFVTVTPTTLENKGTAFAITTSDIASDNDLQDTKGRVSTLEGKVDALASATHFRGVVTDLTAVENPVKGDVVVVNGTLDGDAFSKEYIYSDGAWIELGDTTAELQAIDNNAKAIAKEVEDRTKAIAKEVEDRDKAIAAAITADKLSITDNSVLIDTVLAADGKSFSIADSQKLTDAVALAETSIQTVKGSTGQYATVSVTPGTNEATVGLTFDVKDVQDGGDKLTTAEKVKAYVEAKLNAVAHNNAAGDNEMVKVVTGVSNRADGTGFDVDYTNFEAIDDDTINAMFN